MANVTAYVMTVWYNLPTKTSAIDQSNLNHIEQGIKNVTDFVNTLNATSGLYLSQTPFTTALKNKLDGIEAQANKYVLPVATTGALGGVKIDGTTITIDNNGVIHAAAAATQLSSLTDVNLTDLADGQILKYDANTGKWVNTSEAEVRTQLSLLEDVDIDENTLADGDSLRYNGSTEKWENGPSGDVLDYDETLQALGDPAQNVPSIPIVYSFDEQVIGKWVDGKPLYQKSINFGALPNSDLKSVAHNIADVDHIWVHDGIFEKTNGFTNFIAGVSPTDVALQWWTGVNKTEVQVKTGNDRTDYTYVIVTLRYTKTTDQIPNT